MPTVKLQNGKVILKDGNVSCSCCPTGILVLSTSLCGRINPDTVCGFPEFTAPAQGEEFIDGEPNPDYVPAVVASCPPRFYRTKTTETEISYSFSTTCSGGDPGTCETTAYNYSFTQDSTETQTKFYDEEEELEQDRCKDESEFVGSSSSSESETILGDTYTDTCSSSTDENGNWVGTYVYYSGWEVEVDGPCGGIPEWVDLSSATNEDTTTSTVHTSTSTLSSFTSRTFEEDDMTPWTETSSIDFSSSIITTLSDELTPGELLDNICQQRRCTSEDEDITCQLCCTDRDEGPIDGIYYETHDEDDEPLGCFVPDSSYVAWQQGCEGDHCADSEGRSADLSFVFKDLVPGESYEVEVTFVRYDYAKDSEDNVICPIGCYIPINGVDIESETEVVETFTFTASNWAVIRSNHCDLCSVKYQKCALEDEAEAWNDANPDEPERTVTCSSSGMLIPTEKETYTWYRSATITLAAP
jgi:hypothetical protein